jgi:spectinomycin phosphotransferase
VLTKPGIDDASIAACLEREYGLAPVALDFLPLGADAGTAVYRAVSADGEAYFCKLRLGVFEEIALTLPRFLSEQGVTQIIPPLPARGGQLWAGLDGHHVFLYPFVEGRDAYEVAMSEGQWRELGAAFRAIHALDVPAGLKAGIPTETYSPRWRDSVRTFLERVDHDVYDDPVAAELASFLRAKRSDVLHLLARAEELAAELRARSPHLVICHGDVHAGNALLTEEGGLCIVDWDNPVLACKERDLMSVGGGLFGGWFPAEEEERLFYQGYGPAQIDAMALAYYRYERIIMDIAAFCELIFVSGKGEDREQGLRYVQLNFQPGGTIELAAKADTASIRGANLCR